jgi:hypothetical protein
VGLGKIYHKGWRVVGYSPEHVAEAERRHSIDREKLLGRAKPRDIGEFNLHAWMAKTKPRAVRFKPYEVESAAIQCAELARRKGWGGGYLCRGNKGA